MIPLRSSKLFWNQSSWDLCFVCLSLKRWLLIRPFRRDSVDEKTTACEAASIRREGVNWCGNSARVHQTSGNRTFYCLDTSKAAAGLRSRSTLMNIHRQHCKPSRSNSLWLLEIRNLGKWRCFLLSLPLVCNSNTLACAMPATTCDSCEGHRS